MRRTAFLVAAALALCPLLGLAASSKVTLKMGDNLPDRTNTWGAVIEQINAEFKAANPGVEIVTESYPDQPYQQKIKIYATAKQLPDVFKYWSFSTLLKPLVDGGFVDGARTRRTSRSSATCPAPWRATCTAASSTASRSPATSGSSTTTRSCSRTPGCTRSRRPSRT